MKKETDIFTEKLDGVLSLPFLDWKKMKNKVILITGATGLIGSEIVKVLSYVNTMYDLRMIILALVRNKERAEEKFRKIADKGMIRLIVGDVEHLPPIKEKIDYIIHGASQTASKEFINHSVETIQTAVIGTINLLQLALENKVEGFAYLSSMEMYGYPERGHIVSEEESGSLSPLDLRNSYPISKQICESLCCAYADEYRVPTRIVRLTQTYGSEVNYNDTRIFAYFAKCASEHKNIVLKTKGETERCYLHALDAVTAIMVILLKGENGQAYNAANEETYCSISEMAKKIAQNAGVSVEYQIEDESKNGFPQALYMHLSTEKLRKLGWYPICEYL